MALTTVPLPFGLREVKIAAMTAEGTYAASVALPSARIFSFSESEDFEELRGDDKVIAIRGKGPAVEWELEEGGISLDAYKILVGGAIVDTGTTPNQKRTYTKLATDARPYFKVEGRAISDSGGDFHVVLYKCRVDGDVEGAMNDGEFWITKASGKAVGASTDSKIYEFIQNETAAAIS